MDSYFSQGISCYWREGGYVVQKEITEGLRCVVELGMCFGSHNNETVRDVEKSCTVNIGKRGGLLLYLRESMANKSEQQK
jgi:hypothetical protein